MFLDPSLAYVLKVAISVRTTDFLKQLCLVANDKTAQWGVTSLLFLFEVCIFN
jgi:hypothetical protein